MRDDGTATVRFTVSRVYVETRMPRTGEHAEWDSDKSKTSPLAGFKRFEGVLNHTFEAVVTKDGKVSDVVAGKWPAAPAAKKRGSERDETAAELTHDPTPSAVWLSLIFGATPGDADPDTITLTLADDEKIHVHADATEQVGKYPCVKTRLHSTERERVVKPEQIKGDLRTDPMGVALQLIKHTRKRGNVWFSKKSGCMVKVEMEAQTETTTRLDAMTTSWKWSVELKDRSQRELTPDEMNPLGKKTDPTTTK